MEGILEEDYSDLQEYCSYTSNGRDIHGNVGKLPVIY